MLWPSQQAGWAYNSMAGRREMGPQSLFSEEGSEEEWECGQGAVGEGRLCSCECRCGAKAEEAAERKRQKRKEYKRRQKLRLKEAKEQTLANFEQIVRDIYALRTDFERSYPALVECMARKSDRQRVYDTISHLIREEVDQIRRQLAQLIALYAQQDEQAQVATIRAIFDMIARIRQASPQIEDVISLFVSCHFDDDEGIELPLQRNLDQMTLKFLVKSDLQKSNHFALLCHRILQTPGFARERELFQFMMTAYNQPPLPPRAPPPLPEDDWDEESTGDSLPPDPNDADSPTKTRLRRERRRKFKLDFEQDYQSIMKRVEELEGTLEDRVSCNVSEEWLARMQEKASQYRQPAGRARVQAGGERPQGQAGDGP